MKRRKSARFVALTLAAAAAVACTEQSPVAPLEIPDDISRAVHGASGTYVLTFFKETSTGLAPAADAEPVRTYLVLGSEVRDLSGNLINVGKVTYQYCWSNGDYAPSASCNSGSGSWRRQLAVTVGTKVGFGWCSTPRTIGFRFTFSGRGSGVADGVSQGRDFTWTE